MFLCEVIKFLSLGVIVVGLEDRKNIVRSVELISQNLQLYGYK